MDKFSYLIDSLVYPTDNLAFVTATPASKDHHLPFDAGQYVKAKLQDDSILLLSIANAPREDGKLYFHLRHHPDHPLPKQWLQEIEKIGKMELEGPYGNNIITQLCTNKHLVLLAGGTGFAPIRSLLERFSQSRQDFAIQLFWGVERKEDLYDLAFLNQLQSVLPHFKFEVVLSSALGWVHEYCLDKTPHWKDTTVYASGPFAMVKAAYDTFIERGLNPSDFRSDMEIV